MTTLAESWHYSHEHYTRKHRSAFCVNFILQPKIPKRQPKMYDVEYFSIGNLFFFDDWNCHMQIKSFGYRQLWLVSIIDTACKFHIQKSQLPVKSSSKSVLWYTSYSICMLWQVACIYCCLSWPIPGLLTRPLIAAAKTNLGWEM